MFYDIISCARGTVNGICNGNPAICNDFKAIFKLITCGENKIKLVILVNRDGKAMPLSQLQSIVDLSCEIQYKKLRVLSAETF